MIVMKHLLLNVVILLGSSLALQAAPIPDLFSTGIGSDGTLLGPSGEVDPHYELVESADADFPGPEAVSLNPGFPVPPWLAEGEESEFPESRWIAPRAPQNLGSSPGIYRYRTTFDLSGYDLETVTITGRWATDNGGLEILLNGEDLFISSNGFESWAEFEITEGFVDGENSLEFAVENAGEENNPTGVRVHIIEATGDLSAETPPSIVTAPQSRRFIAGDNVTLNVTATGSPPLTYEWKRNDDIVGDTPTLTLNSISLDQAGDYTVTVSNSAGDDTSEPAAITVLSAVPGLFGTGVDDEDNVLEDLAVDPHYTLLDNPDDDSTEAIVHDSQVFPIVDGPWLANSDTSQWIAPRGDSAEAAGGDYTYRLTFDLTGFDPATALLRGHWASDNGGVAILLNGTDLGLTNDAGFASLTNFQIVDAPFISGENTLDFVVNNLSVGPTGLRVDGLSGGAELGDDVKAPSFVVEPMSIVAFRGEDVILRSLADGTPPLTYAWKRGEEVVGSLPDLMLPAIQPEQGGDYLVEASNAQGMATSMTVTVTVLEPLPGLFDTGVDDEGDALDDLTPDPHYQLVADPNEEGLESIVLNSTVFPIVDGPWVPNKETSKWIGVQEDNNGPPGAYVYRLTFDLSAFDPENVFIEGGWASDDRGDPLILNGTPVDMRDPANFTTITPFRIDEGFVPGLNTLDFPVVNGGDAANPTGVKVEGLRGGGPTEDPNLIGPLETPFGQLDRPEPVVAMVTLRNSGRTEVLTITDARIIGDDAGRFTLGEVPATLPPNESVMIEITVDPQGATGNFSAALELTTNDPSTPVEQFDISAFIPVSPNLIARYPLNETGGDQLIDASGFGRHGTYNATQGNLTLGQDPLAEGFSAAFTEGAFAEAGVLPVFQDFSISLWYTGQDTGEAASLISRGDGQGDPFALVVSGSTLFWFSGGGDPALTLENAIDPGSEHHIVATTADNMTSIYIDGALAASGPSETFVDQTQNPLQFGAANGILGIDGRLDDIQIYNVPLSAAEVAGLFNDPGSLVGGDGGNGGDPSGDAPDLNIILMGNEVTLSWSSEADGPSLTTSTDLQNWSPVETAPEVDDGAFTVSQPLDRERYFRLEP